MKDYLFVFGRDPELSFLEVFCFFKSQGIKFNIKEFKEKVAVISLEKVDADLIKRLGGTVKIGEVIFQGEDVKELDKLNFDFPFNKIRFGVSSYGSTMYGKIKNHFKMRFKKEKYKVTYESGKEITPPKSLRILEQGMELLLFKNYVARLVSVFDASQYRERDKRPCNDFLKSVSIRLAKILINLSGTKDCLLDPFCGVGIILQESNLMGINVIGIDSDKKSVDSSIKNLEWLRKKYNLKANFEVFCGDSRNIKLGKKFDSIVTEPYMGPFIRGLLSVTEAKKIASTLEKLYFNVLRNLKPKRVVFIVPRFRTRERKTVKLEFLGLVKKLGFKVFEADKVKIPIIYADETNKIEREIWVLTK